MSNKTIFDHWDYVDPDDWREEIEESFGEDYENAPDDYKYSVLACYEESDYEDVKNNIAELVDGRKIIAVGSAECWNGTFEGGFIADSVQDAVDKMRGRDFGDIGFYEDTDGELHMTFNHHDGTNDVILRAITSEGCEFIYDNEYDYDAPLDEPELHAKIMGDERYSVPLRYFE